MQRICCAKWLDIEDRYQGYSGVPSTKYQGCGEIQAGYRWNTIWNTGGIVSQKYTPGEGFYTRYSVSLRGLRLHYAILFFANTPFIVQYIARYAILRSYQLMHSPAQFQFWSVCWRCSEEFLFFYHHIIKFKFRTIYQGRISEVSRCLKKKSVLDMERGHYNAHYFIYILIYLYLLCNIRNTSAS